MKLRQPIPVQQLARQLTAELIGANDLVVQGINEIHHVEVGDLSFVDHPKYYDKALASAASVILIDKRVDCPPGKTLLLVDAPFQRYNELVTHYRPRCIMTEQVAASAKLGDRVTIEEGAVIGEHVVIGADCYVQANAVIGAYSVLGNEVMVQAGSVIGSDAFYFKKTAKGYVKWRSGGRVILEDRVDIGANCTVNRGVSSDTIIGAGTKLDCQVQIGHDTKVGKNCLFAAQVGIAGNCHIGDEVVLYGQVGIAQNITIGNGAVVLAKSGVSKDLQAGKAYFGYPAKEARTAYRELAAIRRLSER